MSNAKPNESCWYYAGREDAADAAAGDPDIDMSGAHMGDDAEALADWKRGVADWQAEHAGAAS